MHAPREAVNPQFLVATSPQTRMNRASTKVSVYAVLQAKPLTVWLCGQRKFGATESVANVSVDYNPTK